MVRYQSFAIAFAHIITISAIVVDAGDRPLRLRGSRARVEGEAKTVLPPEMDAPPMNGLVNGGAGLVEPLASVKLRGTTTHGKTKEITLSLDKLDDHVKTHSLRSSKHGHSHGHSHGHGHNNKHHQESKGFHSPMVQGNNTSDRSESSQRNYTGEAKSETIDSAPIKRDRSAKKPSKIRKKAYMLRTATDRHFDTALFEQLYDAPFDVYENTVGQPLEERESFPVFSMPIWPNMTGVFSAYHAKSTAPFIFENTQILLDWKNIYAASNGASDELQEYIDDSNFHSALIIGKTYGKKSVSSFLGLVVSYYQFGVSKNVLIPFARIEDFFEDSADRNQLDPTAKHREMVALHELLNEKKNNSTRFGSILSSRDTRQQRLEQLDITRFQKMFQILIRRTFLVSFGYADCVNREPYELRSCLNNVFSDVVKRESGLRGALEEEMSEMLDDINHKFHSTVQEACITVQGQGAGVFGTGSCSDASDLYSFVVSSI